MSPGMCRYNTCLLLQSAGVYTMARTDNERLNDMKISIRLHCAVADLLLHKVLSNISRLYVKVSGIADRKLV